jgi:hypothetical protein
VVCQHVLALAAEHLLTRGESSMYSVNASVSELNGGRTRCKVGSCGTSRTAG